MANDQAHDPRVALPQNRLAQAVALAVAEIAAGGGGITMPAADYFSDDFESADWNKARPGGGNFWTNMPACSIVTKTAGSTPGVSTMVYDGSPTNVEIFDGRDWTAKNGDHALRVRYAAGTHNNSKAQWKIQDADALPEIYVAFWLRVPENFRKGTSGGDNNKLFWLWMDGRSGEGNGSTVGMEFRGTDSANWYCKVGAGSSAVGGDQGSVPWIAYPTDQGRWMEICIYAKVESSPGADDGLMKVWRRWDGENAFTNTHNLTGQPIKLPDSPAAPQGFVECEMMGYPNAAYAADTEFLLDDVRVSSTPLVPAGTEGL